MSIELLIETMLGEYKGLRSQMTTMVDRQYSLMYWAISTIAIITAAIVNSWDKLLAVPLMALSLFFFFLPILVTLYLASWSHIILQIIKIGVYLFKLERRLKSILQTDKNIRTIAQFNREITIPMGWEYTLWASKPHEFFWRTLIVMKGIVLIFYLICIIVGTILVATTFWENFGNFPSWLLISIIGILLIMWIAVWTFIFRLISRGFSQAQNEIEPFMENKNTSK